MIDDLIGEYKQSPDGWTKVSESLYNVLVLR